MLFEVAAREVAGAPVAGDAEELAVPLGVLAGIVDALLGNLGDLDLLLGVAHGPAQLGAATWCSQFDHLPVQTSELFR